MTALDAVRLDTQLAAAAQLWAPARVLGQTGSTQADLRLDVAGHALQLDEWRLLLADAQTDGRGRTGARWLADPGQAVLLSLATLLRASPWLWPRASLVAGLGAALALRSLTGLDVRIKWPNDLLVLQGDRWLKLGGILCERIGGACGDSVWLCGIGVNVCAVPAGVAGATSLRALGRDLLREDLAAALAVSIRSEIERFSAQDGRLDTLQFESVLAFAGATIEVDLGPQQGRRRVHLDGVDASGGLRVRGLEADARAEVLQPLCITAASGAVPWHAAAPSPREFET